MRETPRACACVSVLMSVLTLQPGGACAPRRTPLRARAAQRSADVLHANQAPLPVIWRHSRSSAFPRALDAVTECSQSTHPTHRWVRKPGSLFKEHFGQQAPAAQLTGAQAPAGELIGHRSPARSRAAFAPRPSGRSCWPLTASAPARQISSVKRTQSTRRDKDGTLFLSACRISNCARAKCTGGNRRAG